MRLNLELCLLDDPWYRFQDVLDVFKADNKKSHRNSFSGQFAENNRGWPSYKIIMKNQIQTIIFIDNLSIFEVQYNIMQ